jgi:hypothetical protein
LAHFPVDIAENFPNRDARGCLSDPRLQSETDGGSCRLDPELSSIDPAVGFIPALLSGGDGRIAADRLTGLNKYFCPAVPRPDLVCASSCTASPVSVEGFDIAAAAFADIVRTPSPRQQAVRLTALTEAIQARLLRYYGITGLAEVLLCPSGTDALLTTAMLIAAERPGEAITAILPSASETGTGVPMAAAGRVFDGPDSGSPLIECAGKTVEIPLRSANGSPRQEDEVNNAFAAAAAAATGNVIVFLTHSTKTGLIAPTSPPEGVNVIVDACQARIEPETVAAYLRRGWPVVVTGSKFFGGPAFSGAVLFPGARLPQAGWRHPQRPDPGDAVRLGTALRWIAALAGLDAFEPLAADMARVLADRATAVKRAIASNSALVAIDGLRPCGPGWADRPSIFVFGLRDPLDRRRLLSAAELRPLYERLGQAGILLGQPVGLGRFGGLRLAFGARDLLEPDNRALTHIFAMLEEATAPLRRFTQQNPWRTWQFQRTSP